MNTQDKIYLTSLISVMVGAFVGFLGGVFWEHSKEGIRKLEEKTKKHKEEASRIKES